MHLCATVAQHVSLGTAFPTHGTLLGSKRVWGFWVRDAGAVQGLDWLEYSLGAEEQAGSSRRLWCRGGRVP